MGQIPRRRTAAEALRERRERLARAELESSLAGLLTGRALAADAVPTWVGTALDACWDVHVDPAATLPDDAAPRELEAWIEGLLADSGVTTAGPAATVFVRTPLTDPPWLECRTREADWLARVCRATGDPWRFLAADLGSFLVVTEEEYRFHAHTGRRP